MPLNPADIVALSRLLDEALAVNPGDREAWLADLPQTHLREPLREMLAEQSDPASNGRLMTLPKIGTDGAIAKAGELVGPYRLLREIGRGGMGSVWLAERADGSFKRQVALKLPRLTWGAGLAERMAREREIDALLEHPNIARLYDAGVDGAGRPYLALEFIDGQPIDTWCTAQGLGVRARLRLFVQVARAVAYAHGRLVVHRDLKPSNVLVTTDGQTHLLDFGIAKLLQEAGQVEDALTQEQGRVMTPYYASPEQIASEPITVASDVYSLGVLLYELLTGELPIAPKRATLGAVEDAILAGHAPLASSRVKGRLASRALRSEVDAILAKAMQREPGRRYATADALAEDIERHLSGETVRARPDSAPYRFRKALIRHWQGASAVSAVAVAVLAGGAIALLQAQRASRAAEREQVVKEFVADVLRASLSAPGAGVRRSNDVAQSVGDGVGLIETRFAMQPELQADLFGVVGSVYSAMGAYAYAAVYLQKRVDQLTATSAAPTARANAALQLAECLYRDGKTERALVHAQQAVALAAGHDGLMADGLATLAKVQLWGGNPAAAGATLAQLESTLAKFPNETAAHAWLQAGRGLWHAAQNRYAQAPALLRKGVEIASRVEGRLSRTAIDIRLVTASLIGSGGRDEAKKLLDEALGALDELGGADAIRSAGERAYFRSQVFGSREVTYAEYIEVVANSQRVLEATPLPVPQLLRDDVDFARGAAESERGNIVQGEYWLKRTETARINGHESPASRFSTVATLAFHAMRSGRHADADAMLLQRGRYRILMGDEKHPFAAYDLSARAVNLAMSGHFDEAEAVLASAPSFEGENGVEHADAPSRSLRWALARVKFDRGDVDGAQAITTTLLAPSRTSRGSDGIWPARRLLAQLQCSSPSQAASGLALLEDEEAAMSRTEYLHSPELAWLRALAGQCALMVGERTKASRYAAEARSAFSAQPEVSGYFIAPLFKLERDTRRPNK